MLACFSFISILFLFDDILFDWFISSSVIVSITFFLLLLVFRYTSLSLFVTSFNTHLATGNKYALVATFFLAANPSLQSPYGFFVTVRSTCIKLFIDHLTCIIINNTFYAYFQPPYSNCVILVIHFT